MFNIHHLTTLMICLSFNLSTIAVSLASDQPQTSAGLLIELTGFPSDNGKAMIALCRTELEYSDDNASFRSAQLVINNGRAVWSVKNLPHGHYAIKAYHDENNNGTLDTSFFGIPTEHIGFSNNARASLSAPSYKDAAFTLNGTLTKQTIQLIQM
jgi:uncharacterized protein (DUF2141 family)